MFFKKDIKTYFNNDVWGNLKEKQKITYIKKLYEDIKRKIRNNCTDLKIEPFLPTYMIGLFNNEDLTITINKNSLMTDGNNLYYIMHHELYHSYQNCLNKENTLSLSEKILQDNNVILLNNKQAYLYINDFGDLFIKSKEVAEIFYYLCSLERKAIAYGYHETVNINPNFENIIDNQLNNFKEKYHVDLSVNDIFNLIDTCYLNIYNDIKPKNDLEATIMYDICIFALYQAKSITENDVTDYLNKTTKQELLEEQGYSIYTDHFIPSNSFSKMFDINAFPKDKLTLLIKNMNSAQKRNNPIFLYKAEKILNSNTKTKEIYIDNNTNRHIDLEENNEFELD